MLGRDHALSGALAFTAVAPLLHVTGVHLAAGTALTAGAGVLPDLDEPGSTIARTFGFLTGAFAWIVHKISGGHRKGTHSLVGVALMTVASLAAGSWQAGALSGHPERWWHLVPAGLILALLISAGFRALHIGGHHGDAAGIAVAALVIWKGWDLALVRNVPVLAVCVTLGMLAHLAGDMCTHDGCPLLYPLSRHEFGLLPEPVRITTNKLAEHWVVSPLLLAGLAYFLWRDAGFSLAASGHLAGRLSRRHHPRPPGSSKCTASRASTRPHDPQYSPGTSRRPHFWCEQPRRHHLGDPVRQHRVGDPQRITPLGEPPQVQQKRPLQDQQRPLVPNGEQRRTDGAGRPLAHFRAFGRVQRSRAWMSGSLTCCFIAPEYPRRVVRLLGRSPGIVCRLSGMCRLFPIVSRPRAEFVLGDGLVDEPATSRVHRYGALSLARSRRITAKHQ